MNTIAFAALMISVGIMQSSISASEQTVLDQIDRSGRCADLGEGAERKVAEKHLIAPGQPPILSFKYYQDAGHHRFGNNSVMLDDAGH